jgi:ABC-type thiamine transport system substrate-binding protein
MFNTSSKITYVVIVAKFSLCTCYVLDVQAVTVYTHSSFHKESKSPKAL